MQFLHPEISILIRNFEEVEAELQISDAWNNSGSRINISKILMFFKFAIPKKTQNAIRTIPNAYEMDQLVHQIEAR